MANPQAGVVEPGFARRIAFSYGVLAAFTCLVVGLSARWLLYPGAPEPFGQVWAVCTGLAAGLVACAVVRQKLHAMGATW